MAKKSKRMTREELRQPDEVQMALKGMWDWIEAHWRTLAAGGVALLVAGAVTASLGMVIERLAIRRMIGEPLFSMAMITLALEVILRTVSFDAVYILSLIHI